MSSEDSTESRALGTALEQGNFIITDPQERLALLHLSLIPGVGPKTLHSLLSLFGTPRSVFEQSSEALRRINRIGAKVVHSIGEARGKIPETQDYWNRARESGIDLIFRGDPDYPVRLGEIADSPVILYRRGKPVPSDELAVAVVGSRHCTLYGEQQAEKIAGALCRAGITVVSGLARGIDGAAHRGALKASGRTIAILATGVNEIYPPEHSELAGKIAEQGFLLSESRLGQQAQPGLFPQRNRIISGMSLGVVVVEATKNSGALHTARHALEQGREVFAVPGRIDSPSSAGCHDLLRDGATLVRHVDDILESLGPLASPARIDSSLEVRKPSELSLNEIEKKVLSAIGKGSMAIDELIPITGLDASQVLTTLTILEMKRLIRRLPGGQVARC